ncbi:hypothetical protein HN698_07665 [Candidatus Woesearchaeota archaeon]|nr:hypothetical protein [Candidatus Woesearchaeota archaeon]
MNTKILEKAGLTNNEIKVYLALLSLGSVSAGEIIKKSELHRAAVYDTLERLMDKGLVSYVIKANRKYFEAAMAKNLVEIIEKKEKQELLKIIPDLEAKRKLGKEAQEVTLFKGNKGLKSIFQDWLEDDKENLVIGAFAEEAESLQYHMKYSLPSFHKRRERKKQVMKFIFTEKSIARAKQLSKYKYTPIRILKAPFASPTSIQIYGEKVAILLWSSDPIGIVMRSKEISNAYREYFKVLWNMSVDLKEYMK